MVDFRKWFLALALVVLTVTTASAQGPAFACTASAGVPPLLRAEGLTELLGDIVLNCTGGDPAVPVIANFQVFLNTNMTSRLIADPYVEAMLMIDEPAPAAQVLGTNVYSGRKVGDNSVAWLGIPVIPPGSVGTRVVRMTGIRGNANQLGVASGLIPTQVFAFISISGSTSVPLNNPQQTVGFIQNGLSFSVRDSGGDSLSQDERTTKQCVNQAGDIASDSNSGTVYSPLVRLRFSENFATAFKLRQAVGGQAAPGVIYNTESGYINAALSGVPPTGALTTFQNAGLADTATRLLARFTNVPAGVKVFVSVAPVGSTGGNNAVYVTNDPNGVGGSVVSPPPATAVGTPRTYIEVPVFGGTGTAVWEVTAADPLQIGRLDFGVIYAHRANTANNLPGLGNSSVNGNFAAISSVGTSNLQSPIPRFADTSTAITALELIACRTSLLFPFVSNQAGFDTGMVIANTSKDPFGTPEQSGTCTLNYYGNTNGGAAPPAQTSNAIPAGEHLAATLSGGGNFGVTATPGFQGYIIAVCQFGYGHGFAFISDVGAQRLAQGYVALVIQGGLSRSNTIRIGSSESLGM